jgi:hypothetical protein
MANKNEYQLIWESYEHSMMAHMTGDEHNPPEYHFDDERARHDDGARDMMNNHEQLTRLAGKYEGLSDPQLKTHIHVLETLVDMGEQDRHRYFGGDLGSPF